MLSISDISSFNGGIKLSELGVSYMRVATNINRFKGSSEDLFQLSETLYCAVDHTRWQSDFVRCFFWSPTLDNLLISAYGLFSNRSLTFARPPCELLLGAPEDDYESIMKTITQRKLPHVEKPVARKDPGQISYCGICLCADRMEFYFVFQEDEGFENKVWAKERICAIGIRTSNDRWML